MRVFSRVTIGLIGLAVFFGAPLFLEGANSSCGAYLARSIREEHGPEFVALAARTGVLGPQWFGIEASAECTCKYWASYFDEDQLQPPPSRGWSTNR
jgi:hypothetical protein